MMLIACPNCSTAFRIAPKALGDEGRSVRCAQCKNVWFATPQSMIAEPVAVTAPASKTRDPVRSPVQSRQGDWDNQDKDERKAAAPPPQADSDDTWEEEEDEDRSPALPRVKSPSIQPKAGRGAVSKFALPFNPLIRRKIRSRIPLRPPTRVSPWTWVTFAGLIILTGLIIGRHTIVKALPGAANIYAGLGFPVNVRGLEFHNIATTREMTADGIVLTVEGQIVNLTSKPQAVGRIRIAILDAEQREIYAWTAVPPKPRVDPYEGIGFRSRVQHPVEGGKNVVVRFLTASDIGN